MNEEKDELTQKLNDPAEDTSFPNDAAFDLLAGRAESLPPAQRSAHHSLVDKKYVTTPGVTKKKIDRETILPSRQIEEKADLLLERQTKDWQQEKRSCWSCLCFFGKGKKLSEFLKFNKKSEKENTLLNILECLFLEYNQGLVNLLWHKPLESGSKKLVLRDDFSHWIHIML